MVLDLSDAEANALMNLIHIAVQARGLETAEAGLALSRKLKAAAEAQAKAVADSMKQAAE